MKNSKMVYSTDQNLHQQIPSKKEKSNQANQPVGNFTALLSISKAGRRGKVVTVIDRLPKNSDFLKELTTELKKKCGAGGTFKLNQSDAMIEIQGDKRDAIRSHFQKIGYKVKG